MIGRGSEGPRLTSTRLGVGEVQVQHVHLAVHEAINHELQNGYGKERARDIAEEAAVGKVGLVANLPGCVLQVVAGALLARLGDDREKKRHEGTRA